MPLDVIKVGRLLELGVLPVQLPHPLMQRRVATSNIANIALEVLHVHRIKPDDGDKQTDIDLSQHVAEPVRSRVGGKVLLSAVESLEEGDDIALVGIGLGGEAGLVDAVVDEVVDPFVVLLDLGAEVFGVKVDLAVLLLNQVVKLGIIR